MNLEFCSKNILKLMMVQSNFNLLDNGDVVIAGNDSELSIILPIFIMETQREKMNASKDIEEMVKKEIEKSTNLSAVEVVNILFGINAGEGKNPYYR